MATTADTIRTWRTTGKKTYTQQELANEIGRAIATLARWERGQGEPGISDLKLMEHLKPGLLRRIFKHGPNGRLHSV
jgi:transcriptional regulator with XRE-family HTH domain